MFFPPPDIENGRGAVGTRPGGARPQSSRLRKNKNFREGGGVVFYIHFIFATYQKCSERRKERVGQGMTLGVPLAPFIHSIDSQCPITQAAAWEILLIETLAKPCVSNTDTQGGEGEDRGETKILILLSAPSSLTGCAGAFYPNLH